MADAPKVEYQAPAELPLKAQTQGKLGRPKRTPEDQAEYFYDVRKMNFIFFVSSLLMLASLVGAFYDDYKGATPGANRDWKEIQKTWMDLELAKLQFELHGIEQAVKERDGDRARLISQAERLEEDLRAPGKMVTVTVPVLDPATNTFKPLTSEVSLPALEKARLDLLGEYQLKTQAMNFDKSVLQTARYVVEEAEHHWNAALKKQDPRVAQAELHYREAKEKYDAIVAQLQASKAAYDEVEARISRIDDQIRAAKAPAEALRAEAAKIVKELEEKKLRLSREKPQLANELRDAPMMDFFDPRIKVQQQLLPNIADDFNFAKIEKNDRCHTCHRTIDNPNYAVTVDPSKTRPQDEEFRYTFRDPFLKAFVDYARGRVKPEESPIARGVAEGWILPRIKYGSWTREDVIRITKTLMAHPSLELYAGGDSPHPIDKMGCTSCHEGDGRETEFSRAVHMPDSAEQEKEWKSRYHYHYRHLWDAPMLPKRHAYSSCRRCHSQDVELPGGEEYTRAQTLYERAGCFACHRTDSYQILPKDTGSAALDPNRKYRRPGPPLTHVKDKVGPEFAFKWILAPKDFRLTTRMPHFFGQSNARTIEIDGVKHGPDQVEAVIVGAMVKYLMANSDTRTNAAIPAPARAPDPKEGLKVFDQVGCRGCHTATPDAEYARRSDPRNPDDVRRAPDGTSWYLSEFGPNLAGIGSKFAENPERGKAWLYDWLRDPKHSFPQSRMPNLRLADQEIHDLVAWLMSLRKEGDFEKKPGMPAFNEVQHRIADHLVFEALKGRMPDVDARAAVASTKGKEEGKLLWLGRRMVQSYGCYSCHEMKAELPNDPATGETTDPLLKRLPFQERPIDWPNTEGIAVEMTGSQPWGNKSVEKLAFGFAEFDGVSLEDPGINYRGVSFEHGATGKPYKHVDPENPNPSVVKVRFFRHHWLKNKLYDPRVFDGGKAATLPPDELLRMPNFYFNEEEVRLLSTFVLGFTHHEVAGLVSQVKRTYDDDGRARLRGQRLVRENNCRACHKLALDRLEVDWERKDEKTQKAVRSWAWVEGVPTRTTDAVREQQLKAWKVWPEKPGPEHLSMELFKMSWTVDSCSMERAGILGPNVNFVLKQGKDAWLLEISGDRIVKRHPVRRWRPTDGGEIIPHIMAYKKAHAEDEEYIGPNDSLLIDVENAAVLYSRLPPTLRSLGVKAQPQWLFEFLKAPHPIRPALAPIAKGGKGPVDLNVRMPTFGFGDEEAGALVKYFWSRDRLKGVEDQPFNAFPERDEALRASRKAIYDELVPFHEKNCGDCHYVGGQAPPGGAEASYKFAPEFEDMGRRLRPRWMRAWMRDPSSVFPGTPMPPVPLTPELEKDRENGIRATVEYLMDYSKFKTPKPAAK